MPRTWRADASVERDPHPREGRRKGRAPAARDPGGAPGREPPTSHTLPQPRRGERSARELGRRRKLEQWRKENRKWRAKGSLHEGGRPRAVGRARSPSPVRPHGPPDVPRGSHLAAPRPGAGGWLVPGLSSSSSSLSREGLRGAKNRERLCQGAPPLLRPPDIATARLSVRRRLLGAREAVSCLRSPARAGPTRRQPPAWLSPSRAGEARARRATGEAAPTAARRRLLPLPQLRPGEEPEAAAPPPPPSAGPAGSRPEARSRDSAARDLADGPRPNEFRLQPT